MHAVSSRTCLSTKCRFPSCELPGSRPRRVQDGFTDVTNIFFRTHSSPTPTTAPKSISKIAYGSPAFTYRCRPQALSSFTSVSVAKRQPQLTRKPAAHWSHSRFSLVINSKSGHDEEHTMRLGACTVTQC